MKICAWILALAMAASLPAQAKTRVVAAKTQAAQPRVVQLTIGKASLKTEIVDTDSLRTQGLSNRRSLDWNAGMLFVFPNAQARTFWMIDCFFDLDIAYLDATGVVRDIHAMRVEPGVPPQNLSRYPSASDDIMYALEINRGWLVANGVKVGDRIPAIAGFHTKH